MELLYGLYYEETNRFGNCERELLCVGTQLELKIILKMIAKDSCPDESSKIDCSFEWDEDRNGFSGDVGGLISFSYYIEELVSAQEFKEEYSEKIKD